MVNSGTDWARRLLSLLESQGLWPLSLGKAAVKAGCAVCCNPCRRIPGSGGNWLVLPGPAVGRGGRRGNERPVTGRGAEKSELQSSASPVGEPNSLLHRWGTEAPRRGRTSPRVPAESRTNCEAPSDPGWGWQS